MTNVNFKRLTLGRKPWCLQIHMLIQ